MSAERGFRVIGAGPAGSVAALAGLEEGARVSVFEKARFPRHKVCGEFLSGEAIAVARRLGVWNRLEAAGAVPIRRMSLHIGRSQMSSTLAEPGYGLSRHALDASLLDAAEERGAKVVLEKASASGEPAVVAHGRDQRLGFEQPKQERLFGFKAHFSGPVDDAVELFLFDRCYVGVSPVEGGLTNVCGLAPLGMLGGASLEPDRLIEAFEPLRERLAPMERCWPWMGTGPLTFGWRAGEWPEAGVYPAGDALGFIDPFTGAGQSIAMLEGLLAGRAAARGDSVASYVGDCKKVTRRMFVAARVIRFALHTGVAGTFSRFVRPEWLFHFTRPRMVAV